MRSYRFLAISAIALLGISACQQEEIAPEVNSDVTHTVTFVAGAPETKTTVDISDGKTAKFAWTAEDVGRFNLYENSTRASSTQGTLTDGVMTIKASFDGGVSSGENTYVAVLNSANDLQILYKEAYPEDADILVSKAISSFDENQSVRLQFKREVAIAKMTLKGLDAGEVVNHITVSSTAAIAGSYGVDGWSSTKVSLDIYSALAKGVTKGYSIVASDAGEAVVWFTCIPQDAATLTVKVEAADGDTYIKKFSNPITLTQGNVKGFGVAMVKDVVAKPWVAVELADIDETMPLVITMATTDKTYALSLTGTDDNALGTSKSPKAIEVSVVNGKLSEEPDSDILWNIANNNGNLTIYPNGVTDKWLYTTDSNSGVRLGTNTSNGYVWSIDATSGYLKANATSSSVRYLGVYVSTPDWRAYTNTTGNTAGQTLRFYSNASTKAAIATPTNLTVSAEKVVSWDAVDGAASYVLTIGTEEYPCTSNSYDASAITDEYYDVAVVAVPTDTENYKNSAAATLTDAKFGTPALPTPTLKEGAVDEFSVTATWTVDSRATSGYNCELFNDETKVGDSKIVTTGSVTFDGLADGVTYTVKVNAIAVEGTKAYADSDVATIDLTTKGTTKISDINAAGTYTVKNAVVFAVANSGVVIIGDGTGLMLLTKSSHGYAVGDTFSTVAGTVAESNGIWQFNNPTVGIKTSGSAPDYGTAVEATSDYLASKPNKVVYVHARGSQSGRYITVGTEKLYMSKANTTNDGKDVDAYGFIYGYSTQYSNTNFCVTSIAEDPTAPKLSVTPTSKTWASDETDAAVFTVTTNTEGVKDWSVSPETLDWATIAVDKTAGTITVTPNDANTTKTALEATLIVTHAAGSLSEPITLTQRGVGSTEVTIGASWTSKSFFNMGTDFTSGDNSIDLADTGQTSLLWSISKGSTTGTVAAGTEAKGVQLQQNAGILLTTTNYSGGVSKIILNMSKSNKGPTFPKVTITVDGKSFTTTSTSFTTSAAEYEFTCSEGTIDATGKTISIMVTSSSSSSYVKYVKINPAN